MTVGQIDDNSVRRMEHNIVGRWFTGLWRNQHTITEHELRVETKGHPVVRELVPHGSDDGPTIVSCLLECRVQVMRLGVSLFNCIQDNLLDASVTSPRLAVLEG